MPDSPAQRRLARLTHVGVVLLAVGAVATVATVLPAFTGADPLPLAAYLLAMLMPVGFAVVLIALLLTARSRGRRARSPGGPGPA